MTATERNKLTLQLDRARTRLARQQQRKLQRLFMVQAQRVGKYLNTHSAEEMVANLQALIPDDEMRELITELYVDVSRYFRTYTARMLGEFKNYHEPIDRKNEAFFNLIANDPDLYELYRSVFEYMDGAGLQKIKTISATTRKDAERILRKIIEQSRVDGLNEFDTADRIRRQLPSQMVTSGRFRAETIARTEVHGAANWSSLQEAKPLADRIVKVWGAFPDADTRQSHREADGQVRELEQPFEVGGIPLQEPGDPMAGDDAAGEVINCRCTILYERKEV